MNKKSKIFFIAPYPKGQAPSQRFRFEQYFEYLQQNGFAISFHSFLSNSTWQLLYSEKNIFFKAFGVLKSFFYRIILLPRLIFAKNIFIHREMTHIGPPIFEFVLAKIFRKKYVYDFDDAIWLPNYSDQNARFQRLKCYWKVKHCIKWADTVTVGNDYLKNYALQYNRNVKVIPTTVDTENYHNRIKKHKPKTKVVIGWTGSHTTVKFLEPIKEVLEQLDGFEFIVISNQPPPFELTNLKFLKWNKSSEIEDLLSFDIGIMPLEDNQWSRGKCAFKAIQYMSLGIPTVVSPVGVNLSLIEDGQNGFIAENRDDWIQKLKLLINDPALRTKIGTNARKTIEKNYSIKSQETSYLNLFKGLPS